MTDLFPPFEVSMENWCDVMFGPHPRGYVVLGDPKTKDEIVHFQCRLPKGHSGDHNCPASVDQGYTLLPGHVVKPKGRSKAARKVFG